MKKLVVSSTMAGVMLLAANSVQAAPDPFPAKGPGMNAKFAFSHDGNSYDPDDWGAVVFAQAVAWAYDKTADVVHLQHSDNPNLNREIPHHKNMKDGVAGAIERFKINPAIVFDCFTQPAEAVANFVKVAGTLSATNKLFFMCAGPMEFPWRCINATPLDKRPFITCVSHSTWNEEFKDKSKTWANMKSLPGGTQFIDIRDQNAGFGKNHNLDHMRGTNAVMDWMYTRATLPDGAKYDVSDAGMTWYAMTGNENGTSEMLVQKLRWKFAEGVSIRNNLFSVETFVSLRNGKVEIRLPELKGASRIVVTNAVGKAVNFPIGEQNSKIFSFESSKLNNGVHFVSIESQDGTKLSIGKVNILN